MANDNDDQPVLSHIDRLVKEEEHLYGKSELTEEDRRRLADLLSRSMGHRMGWTFVTLGDETNMHGTYFTSTLRNISNISARESARIGLDKPVKAKRKKRIKEVNEIPLQNAAFRHVVDTEHGWTDIHAGSIPDAATVTFTLATGRTISASVKYIAALLLDRLNELDGVA